MMRALIHTPTGAIAGYCDPSYQPSGDYVAADLPEGYTDADWEILVYANGELAIDAAAALARVKAATVAAIKTDAAAQITATDWRKERAAEREAIGVAGETLADVMREREAIRQANNRAEVEVGELDDTETVQAFVWSVESGDWPAEASAE